MKIHKLTSIFLMIILADIIVSCRSCCLDTQTVYYTFDNINAYNVDNSGGNIQIKQDGTILKESFGIELELITKEITTLNKLNPGIFSAAYAMEPCPAELLFIPEDSVVSVKITTINEFDNSHPANSDITNYFKIFSGENYYPLNELANFLNIEYEEKLFNQNLTMLLLTPPLFTGEHQFLVEVRLSSGQILSATTSVISLE